MGIQALPNEVLDICFKYLLPPFRSQSLAETYVFTVPVDLLRVRLVCKHFHRLATPLAWRRAQLQIASPGAMTYGNHVSSQCSDTTSTSSAAAKKTSSMRSLVRCRFFREHPELAAHVRVLLLSLEWQSEHPDLARSALRAATQAMTGLRTVLVWDADVLAVRDIQQLLQRPLLRAVCLMDVDGAAFPAQCEPWGKGLKMLHVANSVCPARLIAGAAASLECVSIELARSCPIARQLQLEPPTPTLKEMPWTTLKEVSLVDCVNEEDWFCFLDGFRMHKALDRPTALTELMVGDLAGLEPDRVAQLLHTFAGQPLTRLTLFYVLMLDSATAGSIVRTFPSLRHLTILTEGELTPWSGAVDTFAQTFAAALPHLDTLAWNNFPLGTDEATTSMFLHMSEESLATLYARPVHALSRRIKGLKCVKFVSSTDCIVDSVRIHGARRSGGRRLVEVSRSTEAALHTSSWSTTSGVFEDI